MNHYTFEATLSCGCVLNYEFDNTRPFGFFAIDLEDWVAENEGPEHRRSFRANRVAYHPLCPHKPPR